jgi:hypothetical protein
VCRAPLRAAERAPTAGGAYLDDRHLNQTQRAYYACLETRGYTLTK